MNLSIKEQLEALGFKPLYPFQTKREPLISLNGRPLSWWLNPKPKQKRNKRRRPVQVYENRVS